MDPYLSEAWYRGERTGIEKLAEAFTEYTGASYALPVKSGTAALAAGLAAAGVEAADEVIVVSFTYLASVASILLVNAVPVFADVDRETFTIDPADIVGKITERTKAIMPVDIYGHPADMDAIMEIARAHQIQVVEDACQATGGGNQRPQTWFDCGYHRFQFFRETPFIDQRRCFNHPQPGGL